MAIISPNTIKVICPVCNKPIQETWINQHLDSNCETLAPNASFKKEASGKSKNEDAGFNFFTLKTLKRKNASESLGEGNIIEINEKSNKKNSESKNVLVTKSPKRLKQDKLGALTPLAARVRPTTLDDFIGQEQLIGPQGILRTLMEQDKIPSMILWAPCGCGKTTLARIIAKMTKSIFKEYSGVASGEMLNHKTDGAADMKKAFEEAKNEQRLTGRRTILFLDEIHRFNKAQQDLFLPYVESGTVTLIGATTENPSFKINSALLSRCKMFTLNKLSTEEVITILKRAINDLRGNKDENETGVQETEDMKKDEAEGVSDEALEFLAVMSDGDARTALNALEMAWHGCRGREITKEDIKNVLQKSHLQYDKDGEEHYNIISALHKSMRGRLFNCRYWLLLASLYWLGRMLIGGEDPLYIARRLVRFASEDVGLADNTALNLAVATYQACAFIGMPECEVNLAHCVVYLAETAKSVRVYRAYNRVKHAVNTEYAYPVPLHLRNAPTSLMKDLGYSKGYKYNPNYEGEVDQDYFPSEMKTRVFLNDDASTKGKQTSASGMQEGRALVNESRISKISQTNKTISESIAWKNPFELRQEEFIDIDMIDD
ncbi:5843_t:CDS:10 [Paraglomus occultum]|uniref:5843_t:CDS:1 n=1 Tax=Paraglomus occultum TaxID=144539 RepID=A0A9N8VQ40_9GLOM|nr:5843_t:CDS:10 [Paraglomus occultum]